MIDFTMWAHQAEGMKRALQGNEFAFLWDPGCLSGDTIIKINKNGCSKKYTLAQVYEGFHRKGGRYEWTATPKVRSYLDDEDTIRLNGLVDVLKSGVKETFSLTLENGYSLRATSDHEIMTSEGFQRLDELQDGSLVMVDNLTKHLRKKLKLKLLK